MPRKKKKMSIKVKLNCPTCSKHYEHVNEYHRHLKSKKHIREVTINQAKSNKVNRRLAYGLDRAARFPVPKLCLKCVCLKTSDHIFKYCKIGKEPAKKSWLEQKIEEVYFKTDCSFPVGLPKKTKFKVYVYYCHACNVPLSSLRASKDHYSGKMHLKNLLKMIKNQLSCDLCGSTTVVFNMEEKVSMRESKAKIQYKNFSSISSVDPVPFKEDTFVTDFKTEYIEIDIEKEDEKGDSSVKTERFSDRVSSDELFKTEDIQPFSADLTVKVDTDMKKEFVEEDNKTGIKIGSFEPVIKIGLKDECIKKDVKTEYIEENLKMECFGTDVKTEHIEKIIKTEFIGADIKMECLDVEEKAEYVDTDNIKMECFDEKVETRYIKTYMENEFIVEAIKRDCFEKDVKTEYIEKDIKTEADESPAVKVNHFQCGVCNVRFSSPKVFKAHYVDDAHVKKLLGMIQDESLYCVLCHFSTTNDATFKRHLDNKLHLNELKFKKTKGNKKSNILRK